jgi:hypothetical protein
MNCLTKQDFIEHIYFWHPMLFLNLYIRYSIWVQNSGHSDPKNTVIQVKMKCKKNFSVQTVLRAMKSYVQNCKYQMCQYSKLFCPPQSKVQCFQQCQAAFVEILSCIHVGMQPVSTRCIYIENVAVSFMKSIKKTENAKWNQIRNWNS